MRNFKTTLVSGAALGVIFAATPALAQDAGTEEAESGNTIIVTARRQLLACEPRLLRCYMRTR